jgi:hypothetical protein
MIEQTMPERLFYPATERNRDPILDVLKTIMPREGHIVELASGSGEHVVHFANAFKDILWQPSDLEDHALKSIQSWINHTGLTNIQAPLRLDTTEPHWPIESTDGILCINMIHISPWEATLGLMEKATKLLAKNGFLHLYGPFRINGEHTSASNIAFEGWLKEKDSRFGVRDMKDVENEANLKGLKLSMTIPMPANNFSLVFHKD